MLPLQLLRIKVSNKGKNISPAFCRLGGDSSYELKIATDMIKQFEDSFKKGKRRDYSEREYLYWKHPMMTIS